MYDFQSIIEAGYQVDHSCKPILLKKHPIKKKKRKTLPSEYFPRDTRYRRPRGAAIGTTFNTMTLFIYFFFGSFRPWSVPWEKRSLWFKTAVALFTVAGSEGQKNNVLEACGSETRLLYVKNVVAYSFQQVIKIKKKCRTRSKSDPLKRCGSGYLVS